MIQITAQHRFKLTHMIALVMALLTGASAMAQPYPLATTAPAPMDHNGPATGLDAHALEALVAPVALYTDELLGIVLPASSYPLQIVQAARYLEAHKSNPGLEPSQDWDDTVVALLNYPEVVALLDSDLNWTRRLGEAVVYQETDVIRAVQHFRERAYAAGNLNSDEYKTISHANGAIVINSAHPDVVYVPYYEPARVIYPQTTSSYHYYPRRYPVYNYPYSRGHAFYSNPFWGITTAFTIGWLSHSLHLHHDDYRSHPYYGKRYNRSHFRRHRGNSARQRSHARRHDRHYRGDYWRADRRRHRQRPQHKRDRRHRPDAFFANRGHHQANRPQEALLAQGFNDARRDRGARNDARRRNNGNGLARRERHANGDAGQERNRRAARRDDARRKSARNPDRRDSRRNAAPSRENSRRIATNNQRARPANANRQRDRDRLTSPRQNIAAARQQSAARSQPKHRQAQRKARVATRNPAPARSSPTTSLAQAKARIAHARKQGDVLLRNARTKAARKGGHRQAPKANRPARRANHAAQGNRGTGRQRPIAGNGRRTQAFANRGANQSARNRPARSSNARPLRDRRNARRRAR